MAMLFSAQRSSQQNVVNQVGSFFKKPAGLKRLSRNALAITNTLEHAIAPAANIGESRIPNAG
jgi:UDP-N-acetylenolpyruvoylglucosamine reductase